MKTIKRPFKKKDIGEDVIVKLNSVIERTNLFIINIYNFIKLYSVINPKDLSIFSKDSLYEIFLILRDGNSDDLNLKNFYNDTFKSIYFNPLSDGLLDASYLNQVIKNNIGVIFSAITNNIVYNFDKRLSKFIKEFIKINDKEILEYNSLVKKCSLYEFYNNINNKKIKNLQKEYDNKKTFSMDNLRALEDEINKKQTEKIKFSQRKPTNIFKDELQKIKIYEEKFNANKSALLKFIRGESKEDDIDKHKYKFICDFKKNIFPEIKSEYNEELNENPFKFIESMIFINNYFEKNNIKTFNVFPSRSSVIPKHITLDTASISVIFCNNSYKSVEEHKKEIYKKVFKFPESYFALNDKFMFSGTIQTDGISLSLLYLFSDDYNKKIKSTEAKINARNELFPLKKEKKYYEQELKNISNKEGKEKEKEKILAEIKTINEKLTNIEKLKKEKKDAKNQKTKELKAQKQKEYKENIKKLKEEKNEDELKKINRKNKEFYYIEDLTENELDELKNTQKIIYIDQGKTELIYALNELNNTFMRYSGKERGKVIKTKEHIKNINNCLHYYGIEQKQNELKNLNKKTITKEKLIETLKKMNEINKEIYEKCKVTRLRKEKLEMYIDKQKAESSIINKLAKQLKIKDILELKEYTIVIGDWKGNNNLKNNKSTLGIGMKRLLKKYVKNMYLMDEYNTSKISNKNYSLYSKENSKDLRVICKEHKLEIITENKKTLERTIINKQMHGILTFKMDKKRIEGKLLHGFKEEIKEEKNGEINRFIQRDKNAVLNFQTILKYYLEKKERPLAFRRRRTTMEGSKPSNIARPTQQCIEETKKAVC